MPETFNPRVVAAFGLFTWLASLAAILLGVLVLLGWAVDAPFLKSVLPGLAAMSPLTAIAFVLAGLSLGTRRRRDLTASTIAAILLLCLCAALAASYVALGHEALNPALEHGLGLLHQGPAGHTAPATLIGFSVLGGALLSLDRAGADYPDAIGSRVLACFAVPGLIVSGLALLCYAYGVEGLYATAFYRSMAVHTATGLFVMFLACLVCEPKRGLAGLVASALPSGRVTRMQLLMATFLPAFIGLLVLRGIRAGSLAPSLGMAILVTTTMVPLVFRIMRDANLLDTLELERAATATALQAFTDHLEDKIRERTASLKLTQANLTAYFDHAPEGLVMLHQSCDGGFTVQSINPAFRSLFALGDRDVTGATPWDWLDADSAREVSTQLLTCLATGRAHRYSARRQVGQALKILDVILAPVPIPNVPAAEFGPPVAEAGRFIIASVRDVTDAELREEQLRQSQKMEAVGQLTGGLAHDFNNLLTGITGSLELLGTRIAQGRVQDADRYITGALGAAKRAATLTHRLLAFSRRQTLIPQSVDINRLITGMEDLIRRAVGLGIEVEFVGAVGLWPALVDANQLENALLNLCINARDAMPNGGRITIETANKWLDGRSGRERDLPPGQYLSLCVTDSGTGMGPEVMARAFDPFYTTKPIGQGTGLGLSMTYGFIRQSGGQVRIYSEPGQGTTICLYMPRHHVQPQEAVERHESRGEIPRAQQGETVLIVDDEPTIRMLVTEVLGELGYTAIEAADGPSGLRVLQSDARIDLLITDIGLPGSMNGRQMAEAGQKERPALKVLFITGYAENAVFGNGHLNAGMHLLTKPFAMETLGLRIRELIVQD